jgi:hypothetical protein
MGGCPVDLMQKADGNPSPSIVECPEVLGVNPLWEFV